MALTDQLLNLENRILDAMITVRYTLEDPTRTLAPDVLPRIRRMADMFAAAAERIQADQEREDRENEPRQ